MFREIRYQTGEIKAIKKDMENGIIPKVDVDDYDDLDVFLNLLENSGIYAVKNLPRDRKARDTVKEPEFEFRMSFCSRQVRASEADKASLMYIDFYFKPIVDRDYDSIFGD